MKTLYFSTFLLIALIGGAIYLTVSYQPPAQAPVVAAESSSSAAPTVAISTTSLPASATVTSPASSPTIAQTGPSPTAPAAPGNLLVDVVSPTQANLTWSPPSDTQGIIGYAIYRNFSQLGVTPDTVYSDVDYSSQYTYSYNVTSYDKNGLQSAYSRTFTIDGDSDAPAPAPQSSTPNPAPTVALAPAPAPTPTPSPTPKPSPTPTPTKSSPACGSGGSCTPAQIAAHNSRGNCWVYLSQINKAYNITSYVANPSLHPGGDVIAPHCGTDIYNYFLGTAGGHKHSANALNNVLQAYYIGPMS